MNIHEKLSEFVKGDPDALAFILNVHSIVEVWDDLIDRDKPVDDQAINDVFHTALITLPRNPFYQRNFALLSPIFEAAIFDWHTANAFEARGGDALRSSYTLRCGVLMLTVMAAKITGGVEWAKEVGVKLRDMGDTWADYSSQFGDK